MPRLQMRLLAIVTQTIIEETHKQMTELQLPPIGSPCSKPPASKLIRDIPMGSCCTMAQSVWGHCPCRTLEWVQMQWGKPVPTEAVPDQPAFSSPRPEMTRAMIAPVIIHSRRVRICGDLPKCCGPGGATAHQLHPRASSDGDKTYSAYASQRDTPCPA